MLYRFAKTLMKAALRFFYRRVFITGLEVIPADGPAIIIANHPSSLMDAALLGLLIKRPLYFLTRADVFVSKPVNFILSLLHMIPVQSHDNDRDSIEANSKSFEKAAGILSKGGILLFFPEGNSSTGHKLFPLRKGVFRLAFQTAFMNDFKYNIPFIPVGINYEHPADANKDVMIHFGEPFFLNDYREKYEANQQATLLNMTKVGFQALEKNVLHIADTAAIGLAEDCLTVYRNNYYFFTKAAWQQATKRKFFLEKTICNQINQMTSEDLGLLKKITGDYFSRLKLHCLSDRTLCPAFSFSTLKKLLLIVAAPLFIAGWLLNAIPVLAGKMIADKKVYRIDFYSWIFVTSSALLYIIWLLMLFAGFSLTSVKYAAAVVPFALLSGILCRAYKQWLRDYKQYRLLRDLKQSHPHIIDHLQTLRLTILSSTTYHSLIHQQLLGLAR
ncbi:MAG: 1-acyl-sn-glycerol-3-phosphate acyltransferase [Chitinophagaceae bacterium]|nr:1-acyl-sn-glycerol-3-phosphate acyltransferase [Chitinophagaceae bacterium]